MDSFERFNESILPNKKAFDSFERFNESILPNKKAFYSKLNLENITDKDYIHAKKAFKKF